MLVSINLKEGSGVSDIIQGYTRKRIDFSNS